MQTITEHQRRQLSEDLPRDVVRTRDQAGQRLSYVDGWYAVSRANEVFGPDGWSYAVREVREVYRGTKPGKGTDENTVIVYEALVAVTALGITREDVGIGQCDASIRALAQGIEKARKESVTDGLKRALRTFGPSFGLALYDKDQRDVGLSRAAMDLRADLEHAADVDAWVQQHGAAVRALADDERDELRALVMRRREEAAREAAGRAAAAEVTKPAALPALASLGVEVQAPATTPAPVEARDLVAEVRDSAAVRHTVRELADLWRSSRDELKAASKLRPAWEVIAARALELKLTPAAVKAEVARLDDGPGPKGGTPRPEAPTQTDATGTGQDVAAAAAAVALVPSWCSDVDAMERHIEGYSHAVAVERCARKHRGALPRAARELLALRLQRLSWDPHDGEITLESARELVSRWIAQGPVERVRPEARAKIAARRAVG